MGRSRVLFIKPRTTLRSVSVLPALHLRFTPFPAPKAYLVRPYFIPPRNLCRLGLRFLKHTLTYGDHWVLTGLANKFLLKALWVAVDRGTEALDDWSLGRIERRL